MTRQKIKMAGPKTGESLKGLGGLKLEKRKMTNRPTTGAIIITGWIPEHSQTRRQFNAGVSIRV